MRGFSIPEVLVASGILVSGALALAVVVARSIPLTISAGYATRAAMFAAQRVEQLRGAPAAVEQVEFLDGSGRILAAGERVPPGAIFVRRVLVAPLPGSATGAEIVTVVVEPLAAAPGGAAAIVGVRGAP